MKPGEEGYLKEDGSIRLQGKIRYLARHMALANSAALKLAGIGRSTISPEGGVIEKDPGSGESMGIFRDEAMSLVSAVIPPLSEQEMDECLQRVVKNAFENGVTYINDMGSYGGWPDLKTYQRAYNKKELDLRIYSFVPLSNWLQLHSFIKKNGRGTDMLHWGGVKGFVDGSLGSTTAWFYQPYLDDPTSSGLRSRIPPCSAHGSILQTVPACM